MAAIDAKDTILITVKMLLILDPHRVPIMLIPTTPQMQSSAATLLTQAGVGSVDFRESVRIRVIYSPNMILTTAAEAGFKMKTIVHKNMHAGKGP